MDNHFLFKKVCHSAHFFVLKTTSLTSQFLKESKKHLSNFPPKGRQFIKPTYDDHAFNRWKKFKKNTFFLVERSLKRFLSLFDHLFVSWNALTAGGGAVQRGAVAPVITYDVQVNMC